MNPSPRAKLQAESVQYRPDIDGLRAVAIFAVIGYHAFPGWVPNGFIGVDIFFVISGFLISGIIVRDRENACFSYAEFYARRVRRLFPSLIPLLVFSFVFGWYVLLSDEFWLLGKHMLAGAGFVSNFTLWDEVSYFDKAAYSKPLLHLWSLAIEEQFYMLWPLLLGLAWRWNIPIFKLNVFLAVASFCINIFLLWYQPNAAFYFSVARFWELMAGAILAYVGLNNPEYLAGRSNARAGIGLLLIVGGALMPYQDSGQHPVWVALAVVGALLMISAGPVVWLNKHILGSTVLVWIGLISYPLYLWHWTLMSFAWVIENGMPPREVRIALVAASFVLAWFSYLFIERRVRYRKGRSTLIGLVGLMALTASLGLVSYKRIVMPRNSVEGLGKVLDAIHDRDFPGGLVPVDVHGQVFYYKKSGGGTALFIGDSHIQQYGPRIVERITRFPESTKTVYFATALGCPFIPGYTWEMAHECTAMREAAISFALSPEIEVVAIGACWNCYFIDRKKDLENGWQTGYFTVADGRRMYLKRKADRAMALAAMKNMIEKLSAIKKVYFIIDTPRDKYFDPKNYLQGSRLGAKMAVVNSGRRVPYDKDQRQLRLEMIDMAEKAGAIVIDPTVSLCIADMCLAQTDEAMPIYSDEHHLRPFYVKSSAGYIDSIFTVAHNEFAKD